MQLKNYAAGQWVAGSGKQADLLRTTRSGGADCPS